MLDRRCAFMTRFLSVVLAIGTALTHGFSPAHAQHHEEASAQEHSAHASMPLTAPGHDIFGTVQEAIRALEADSTTDWSEVDVEALRRHLIDMHHVAQNVRVEQSVPIEGGVRLVVRPTVDAARPALERVLEAHPPMLQHDEGWAMKVTPEEDRYVLRVTDPSKGDVDKIRGLGYIGLLALGPHHQHHHWMMVRGQDSHH